jgi:TPP-dependent indolepyruvate ferredoxin oxidoreductase alpha subunit
MQQPNQAQIKIELGEKEAEGIYANLAMIMHSPTEIVIDFARAMPRTPKARVLARIIMTPMHAKVLVKTLEDNLKKFEAQFGEIKLHGVKNDDSKAIGFGSGGNYQSEENK